ncbi:MAG TPA: cytochrome c oxidase subunit 3 [Candidatus Eisenbacteria bacterium]|nr:cytochrome c oxidase subunit 3 [Candidatus Eisenbacteria bacterium]
MSDGATATAAPAAQTAAAHADPHGSVERAATTVPTGRLGIWWFLASEIVIFGGLVTCYVLFRLRHPEWGELAAHTLTPAGAVNTFVLLTSSLTIVLAHDAAARGKHRLASQAMMQTLFCGAIFMGIKAFEYGHEIAQGFTPVAGLFWSFYYSMTGLHALHVLGGMVAIYALQRSVARGEHLRRVEYVGIYWHFVDIVWIFLFPLLYLASRG